MRVIKSKNYDEAVLEPPDDDLICRIYSELAKEKFNNKEFTIKAVIEDE